MKEDPLSSAILSLVSCPPLDLRSAFTIFIFDHKKGLILLSFMKLEGIDVSYKEHSCWHLMSEGNSTEIGNLINAVWQNAHFQVGLDTTIITTTASLIISISAYFVKRRFALIDFQNQQDIEQSSWLLKKLHEYTLEHYPILTRSFYNAEKSLLPSNLSTDDLAIKNAYEQISQLIKNYWSFRNKTGGMILLLDREKQNEAIGKIQSLNLSLPFDDKDYSNIQCNQNSRAEESFKRWIKNNNCPKSVTLVRKRLYELRSIFDTQTEKILQHESFLKSRKHSIIKKIKNILNNAMNRTCKKEEFYIHDAKPKYVKSGDIVNVIGLGFSNNEEKEYVLFFNGEKINDSPISKTMTKIKIPEKTPSGTFEITAEFPNDLKKKEEMGIVIHVNIESES